MQILAQQRAIVRGRAGSGAPLGQIAVVWRRPAKFDQRLRTELLEQLVEIFEAPLPALTPPGGVWIAC